MPPLSRLDLPRIVEAVRELYRIIADPPAENWRAPTWLIEQYKQTTLGEAGVPEKPSHAGLIHAAAVEVLNRIMPPWHHTKADCSEINDSLLDLRHKVILLGLRERLSGFALGQGLASNRSEAFQFLAFLESALEQLEDKMSRQGNTVTNDRNEGTKPPRDQDRGSGAELLDRLEISGTGQDKLHYGRVLLQRNPDATAAEVIEAMEAAGVTAATIEKARRLVSDLGRPLSLYTLTARLDNVAVFTDPNYRAKFVDAIQEWPLIRYACERLFHLSGEVRSEHVRRLVDALRFEAGREDSGEAPLADIAPQVQALLEREGSGASVPAGGAPRLTEKGRSSAEDILEKAKAEYQERLEAQRQADEADARFRRIMEHWDRVRYFTVDEFRPEECGLAAGGEEFWTRWAGHIVALCQELKAQCPLDRLDHLNPGEDAKTYTVEIFKAGWEGDEEAVTRLLKAISTYHGASAQFQGRVNEWLRRDLMPEIMGWKPLDSAKTAEAGAPRDQGGAGDGGGSGEPETYSPPAKKPRRSTERGEARLKIISALTKHHQYANGSCPNLEPIGNNELAKAAGVSPSTASTFFNNEFEGHTKYKSLSRDSGSLVAALKLLNNEFSPHNLYGRRPPGEDDRDDEGDE